MSVKMFQSQKSSKHLIQPDLSIILPVLNEEDCIEQLLSLLAKQKKRNFEVIVVDGKSEDETVKVVKRFMRQHTKIDMTLLYAPHKGVSYQKNIGAKKARADIILFLDADVSFGRTFIRDVLMHFNHRHFDIATTPWFPSETKSVDNVLSFLYNRYQELTRKISPVTYGWMILVKKKHHLKAGGFDERLYFFEDSDYVKRIVKLGGKFQILHRVRLFSSSRRAHREGRIAFEVKMVKFFVYYLFFGHHIAQTKIRYSK